MGVIPVGYKMRCLAMLLAQISVERPDGLVLGLFTELLGFRVTPSWQNLFLYAQVEMDRDRRGLPVEMRVDLTPIAKDGGRGRARAIHSVTGIVQMPLDPGLPPICTINHEIRFEFAQFGIYEVGLYLDGDLAASRLLAVVDSSPKDG